MKPVFSLFCLYLRHTFWKVLLLLLAAGAVEGASSPPAGRGCPTPPICQRLTPKAAFPWIGCWWGSSWSSASCWPRPPWPGGRPSRGTPSAASPLSGTSAAGAGAVEHPGLPPVLGEPGPGLLGDGVVLRPGRGLPGPPNPPPMAVWQVPRFYAFLPLGAPLQWLGNLALALGLGFTAAAFTQALHRGKWTFAFPTLALCALVCLGAAPLSFLAAGACLVWGLWQALRPEAPDRDDDNDGKEVAPPCACGNSMNWSLPGPTANPSCSPTWPCWSCSCSSAPTTTAICSP